MNDKNYNAGTPDPEQIRAMREDAELTQSEAAAEVYVTLRTWQKWEGAERAMPAGLWELFLLKTGVLEL
jgi:putative transcriptional regulator